jgi:hypothetical protein
MKTEFIAALSRSTAKRLAPWAAVIIKVTGGFRAFESVSDYKTWRAQR